MRSLLLSLALLTLTTPAWATQKTNQAASSVLGQPDFTSGGFADPPTNRSLSPEDIAVDPTTGKVFVCDGSSNRVLRFSSTAAYQTNSAAEAVFGQPDLDTTTGNSTSATNMEGPYGIEIGKEGSLLIGDYGTVERVLHFPDPAVAAAKKKRVLKKKIKKLKKQLRRL